MSSVEAVNEAWQPRLARLGLTELRSLLDDEPPDELLPGSWQPLVKDGLGRRERWRWEPPDTSNGAVYLKRYFRTPLKTQLDRILRQSSRRGRGWWEYHLSRFLAEHSVACVQAIAAVDAMTGHLERRSAVLFAEVAGDAFDRVWPKLCIQNAPITGGHNRHAVNRALARFVSSFHQTGYVHRDLYLCHVFADIDPSAQRAPQFALIDLARVFRPRLRRTRWLIKDLAQLDSSARRIGATRTDRFRFLVYYLSLHPSAPRVRWFARRITRKSDWILRRIARKEHRG